MTLAADVSTAGPVPAFPIALRDGWAVRAATISDAGPYSPVQLSPAPLWVETGEKMPDGMDAVLPADAVHVSASGTEVVSPATPGEGVLAPGGDAEKGVLGHAEEVLRASRVAALRAAGITKVSARGPRVNIFSVNIPSRSGGDTITPLLVRAVEQAGGVAEILQAASLESALLNKSGDFVLTVGGTGGGKKDNAVKTLARVGKVEAHGFGIAPGETAAFGFANDRPVLMLPGRLDAALAAFLIVGTEIIARLAGRNADQRSDEVKLTRKITSTVSIAEMIPVRCTDDGVEPLAAGMLPLSSLAAADGWVLVPPQSEGFAAGSTVRMRPLP